MHRLTLLSILVMFSCGSKPSVELGSYNQIETHTQKSYKVPQVFIGNWISKNYIDKLIETKSTKQAQLISDLCLIEIQRVTKDSVVMSTVWNFHEGGNQPTLRMIDSLSAQTDPIYDSSNLFVVKMNPEGLLNIVYEENSIDYIKYGEGTRYRDYVELVNEVLFAGEYVLDTSLVKLLKSGELLGFQEYVTYKANEDYYDAGMNFDKIYFLTQGGEERTFGYEFKHDTLEIFQLECVEYAELDSTFCVVHARGEIIYSLIKY